MNYKRSEELFKMVEAQASPVESALTAYHDGLYSNSINLLSSVLDREPNNWQARLYLGFSYQKANQIFFAQAQYKMLQEKCTDPAIILQAESALAKLFDQ